MKKALKIFFGFLVVFLVALFLIPTLFQDKIIGVLKEQINKNINADVEFTDANLSLLRSFPSASIKLEDISIVNLEPFKGDTLFYGKEINLKLKITDVFKGDEINIKSFTINGAKINVLVNENGQANYDIAKKESKNNTEKTEDSLNENKPKILTVDSYAITNSQINYIDKKGKLIAQLTNFNHSGNGDFSAEKTMLDTKTSTEVYVKKEDKEYVENLHLDLNALLDLDLKNNKFSFLENQAHINQLPLIFDGFVQVNENNQVVNVNFKTPSSDFKNFLALIPKQYAKNIADVKTSGNFNIGGKVNGVIDDKHIPKINININSNNASFKYPSLPKSVQNIQINTSIKNNTGLVKDTYVNVNNLSFKIDDNVFAGKANIKNLTTNPLINATAKGKLNLAHIEKVYPIETAKNLSGIIDTDLNVAFDIEAMQKNIYQRIKKDGKISINDFVYASKDVVNPISIKNAQVDFKPTSILLTNFEAKTGSTDLNATGKIDNLLGFLLSDKKLKGNFALNSSEFRVSDFMQKNEDVTQNDEKKTNEPNSQKESLKIPAFLDIVTKVNAKKVHYDNLELTNVTGTLILKDEKAILKGVNADMFDGKIALGGTVNTKNKIPVFDMKMGIKSFNISKSMTSVKMFEAIAPIAGILDGKFNTNIDVKGSLNNDFTPNLSSISGDALAQVLTQRLNPEKSKTMSLLNNKLNFIDLKKLNLDNIKTALDFKDGKVNVKPFKVNYKDIGINIGGSHGFDKSMNYKVTLDVPAKYLGNEVASLLAKVSAKDKNTTVPITANLSGSFTNPTVKTDVTSAVTNLTSQLIKKQKNKLINSALSGLLGNKEKSGSTKEESKKNNVVEDAKNIFNGLFGKKKSKKDSKN